MDAPGVLLGEVPPNNRLERTGCAGRSAWELAPNDKVAERRDVR